MHVAVDHATILCSFAAHMRHLPIEACIGRHGERGRMSDAATMPNSADCSKSIMVDQ